MVEGELLFAWTISSTGEARQLVKAPLSLYEGIVADPDAWAALRNQLDGAYFVDIKRILVSKG